MYNIKTIRLRISSFVVLLDRDGLPVVSSFDPYFLTLRLSDDSTLTLELS